MDAGSEEGSASFPLREVTRSNPGIKPFPPDAAADFVYNGSMSKFFNIDDWETVDAASIGVGMMAGAAVAAPLAIGFSIFMAGEAGTPAMDDDEKDNVKPFIATKKSDGPRDIMAAFKAPRPTWA